MSRNPQCIIDAEITACRLPSQADVSSAEELDARGRHLMEDDHYAVDCIRPKCLELQRMVMQYRDMVRARNLLLQRSLQLQTDVDLVSTPATPGGRITN